MGQCGQISGLTKQHFKFKACGPDHQSCSALRQHLCEEVFIAQSIFVSRISDQDRRLAETFACAVMPGKRLWGIGLLSLALLVTSQGASSPLLTSAAKHQHDRGRRAGLPSENEHRPLEAKYDTREYLQYTSIVCGC